jgi:hypothetical protein
VYRGSVSLTNANNLLAVAVYVGYRSYRPDETTVKDVLNDLQDNNIDVDQLVEITTDHCEEAESSIEGESFA